eukprot:m.40168 g.40168  ORF g.40168 m.40168 type:complete len:80 (-) comp45816_c0_seq1:423-662(-)
MPMASSDPSWSGSFVLHATAKNATDPSAFLRFSDIGFMVDQDFKNLKVSEKSSDVSGCHSFLQILDRSKRGVQLLDRIP